MNILLIDNGTIRIIELQKLLQGNNVTTIKFGDIKPSENEKFDLIILSGSSQFPVLGNEQLYQNELSLIRNTNIPLVGICLGFELICYAYGGKLRELENKEKGIIEIQVTNPNGIFSGLPNFQVYESHQWTIDELPDELIEIAKSKNGVEVIKYKNRKIYGFQFHPEMFVEKTCGDEIFNNLLATLNQKF